MPDFGPDVGIQFTEAASGFVANGISDAVVGERRAKADKAAFEIALRLSIPLLQEFLGAQTPVADIVSGTVSWKPALSHAPILPGGKATLFRKSDPAGKHKFVDYDFSFVDQQGRTIRCTGVKDLQNDNGLDATADLST